MIYKLPVGSCTPNATGCPLDMSDPLHKRTLLQMEIPTDWTCSSGSDASKPAKRNMRPDTPDKQETGR
jgi:hypothetical protein